MKTEQTAVEWLIDEIEKIPFQSPEVTDYYNDVIALFAKAKQMEKEQIVASHKEGQHYANNFEVPHHIEAEQYHQSKYGKDENKAENND